MDKFFGVLFPQEAGQWFQDHVYKSVSFVKVYAVGSIPATLPSLAKLRQNLRKYGACIAAKSTVLLVSLQIFFFALGIEVYHYSINA